MKLYIKSQKIAMMKNCNENYLDMKRFIFVLALCFPLVCSTLGYTAEQKDQIVYICTGPQAKVYHRTDKCKGLNKCSGSVNQVTIKKAQSMKRRACKICY